MDAARREQNKAERLSELGRAYRLADLYAFGSRADEIAAVIRENKALTGASSSDADIGIRPKKGASLSPRYLVNLTLELEDLFGANRVDLVLLPDSEPFLALDIIRGELLYTEDPLDQAYFELLVLRRAGDLLPFKRERIDMILQGGGPMMASSVRAESVTEKIAYIRKMVEAIRTLPLSSYDDFSADARNAAAAESYLRRALEALFDLGRHILVKAFAEGVAEYKQIADGLTQKGVLSTEEGRILREMAGYRDRMVHFYHEIGKRQLYNLCRDRLVDIQRLSDTFVQWLREHPEKVTGLKKMK